MSDEWVKAGVEIAKAGLPFLGGLIAGPVGATGGAVIANTISNVASTLGIDAGDDDLSAKIVATVKTDPDAAIKLMGIEADIRAKTIQAETEKRLAEINADIEETKAIVANMDSVNLTYRQEILSSDEYVRHMRPTYGYVVSIVLFVLALSFAVASIVCAMRSIDELVLALKAYADLARSSWEIIAAVFAVLGVYIKKRSDDKAIANGKDVPPFVSLFKRGDK